jgi:hypothetical protein
MPLLMIGKKREMSSVAPVAYRSGRARQGAPAPMIHSGNLPYATKACCGIDFDEEVW